MDTTRELIPVTEGAIRLAVALRDASVNCANLQAAAPAAAAEFQAAAAALTDAARRVCDAVEILDGPPEVH